MDTRDGGTYVALFNLSDQQREVSACWEELGLSGPYAARDLWAHQDAGVLEGRAAAVLPPHGSAVYKLEK